MIKEALQLLHLGFLEECSFVRAKVSLVDIILGGLRLLDTGQFLALGFLLGRREGLMVAAIPISFRKEPVIWKTVTPVQEDFRSLGGEVSVPSSVVSRPFPPC